MREKGIYTFFAVLFGMGFFSPYRSEDVPWWVQLGFLLGASVFAGLAR